MTSEMILGEISGFVGVSTTTELLLLLLLEAMDIMVQSISIIKKINDGLAGREMVGLGLGLSG